MTLQLKGVVMIIIATFFSLIVFNNITDYGTNHLTADFFIDNL